VYATASPNGMPAGSAGVEYPRPAGGLHRPQRFAYPVAAQLPHPHGTIIP
jgi:hypothetical protein